MNRGPLPGGTTVDAELWLSLNQAVIAKMISELAFEEAFHPEPVNAEGSQWLLRLSETVAYRFKAERRIWGNLSIEPASLKRQGAGKKAGPEAGLEAGLIVQAADAAAFLVDAGPALNVEPDTLSIYVRELYNTLMADARIAAISAVTSGEALLALPDSHLQHFLDGHPKAPASKGRIGWGLGDYEAYAPEFQPEIRLFWLAADRESCRLSLAGDVSEDALLAASLDEDERARLEAACAGLDIDRDRYLLMPVHPWQWDNMIVAQFAGEIAAGRLIPLGPFGDAYLPLQSLRTLANARSPAALHVKLALTILNTSAWRGIPGKYMTIGPAFSEWLAARAGEDPELAGTLVLRECAGAFYPHPLYERIEGAPYQFREMLGVIWRESPEAKMQPGQTAMMLGALIKTDSTGHPLASLLVARSGLGHHAWLARLFEAVAVPLYHFMCCYGVGFIAHGQNITVILQDGVPCGVALKDFQGDVDLVDEDFPQADDLPPGVRQTLLRRPPAHLLQHLQTGHFASVLRFLSDALAGYDRFAETTFYAILAEVLRTYQARHPELGERFVLFDLFTPKVPRICINRVRLAVGYGDSNRRPVPSLGTELANPLHSASPLHPTKQPSERAAGILAGVQP